ncbi:glycosyltransferase [Campylobacter sp. 19-13652]|uniref:glycosyltransferase n=1 Tax=Campylobacter sp. 19-13652 TaxID=2840180 RepID=UPI0021A8624B|nr:glycosyltransferase [Campylobacter sp. 19-13652]
MYNPVDLKIPLNLAQKENIVLFPSRLDKNKRLDFLICAFSLLDDELKRSYKIVVCGDGEERASGERLAKSLGINLQVLGFVKDIQNYYAKAKVVAMSSRSEGFGNVLVEAIPFDCARISTKAIAGPAELIKDGWDGFLSEIDDVNEFSQKLGLLLRDDGLRAEFCKNARARLAEFDPKHIAQKWVDLANRALKI